MIERTLFTADHEAFRDSFRRFMDKEIAPHHEAWEEQGYVDRAVWSKAGENGFLCMTLPEAYGGSDADKLYSVVQMEELSRAGFTGIGEGAVESAKARACRSDGFREGQAIADFRAQRGGECFDARELAASLHGGESGFELDASAEEVGEFLGEEQDLLPLELDRPSWICSGFSTRFRGGFLSHSGCAGLFESEGAKAFFAQQAHGLRAVGSTNLTGDDTGGAVGAVGEGGHEIRNDE
jgi:hypothetical protein